MNVINTFLKFKLHTGITVEQLNLIRDYQALYC